MPATTPSSPAARSGQGSVHSLPISVLQTGPGNDLAGTDSQPPPTTAGLPPGISLTLLVLALAFLLAFMPVRNSDFWLHLASGRSLLDGQDPSFSYMQEAPGFDRTWLYDIVLYRGFSWLGATTLVSIKACLAVVLAWLLINAGRVGRSFWLPAGATMLALVAMGPWLSFRPMFLSFLCFAAVLGLLRQLERRHDLKRLVALTALFALWANLDSWFILGVLLVACWSVGRLLRAKAPGQVPADHVFSPALILLCSVCAPLLNPHHVFAYEPGGEWLFSGVARHLQSDYLLRAEMLAPWREVYLSSAPVLWGPGVAFWGLLVLSLLSFVLTKENRSSLLGRGLPWGVFLLLSFLQTQVIPFFALVAAVTLALNAGAWLAKTELATAGRVFLARVALLSAVLALGAGAWIGFFQSSIREPRRGTLEIDPALERLAHQLVQWRGDGRLGDGNGFHLAPEAANQLAWLCPEERGFLNSHLRVSPAQASEYVAVRNGLLGRSGAEGANWLEILRTHQINHVVVYSARAAEAEQVFGNLLRKPDEWPLLCLSGGAAVFGWRDPLAAGAKAPFATIAKSLDQLAYDATQVRPAAEAWPGREPEVLQWWQAFWKGRQFRTPDLREAYMAVAGFDALAPMTLVRHAQFWNAAASAGLVAEEACPLGFSLFPPTAAARRKAFFAGQDDGPAAALYLAVRAARRAIDQDPQEASAYFALGEAYYRLITTTRERSWSSYASLGKIRTVQAMSAYQNALLLNPDLTEAHNHLADLFISMDYKDLALEQLREYVRCVRLDGARARASREVLEKRLARPQRLLRNLGREVDQLAERFDINAANLKVFDRASLAGRMGLAGKALEILLDSDVSAFGATGMDLELKLLLLTGNTRNVRLWMSAEHKDLLQAYHWNKIQLYAGLGDYAKADAEIAGLEQMRALGREDLTLRGAAGLILGSGLLSPAAGGLFQKVPLRVFWSVGAIPSQTYRLLPDESEIMIGLKMVAHGLNREAKLDVLRGLLALESGQIAHAEDRFRHALLFLRSSWAAPFASEPDTYWARLIAEHGLTLVERPRHGAT